MSNHPLLSVIIPVYNAENYLRQCLDSVLAQQDFSDYEVILVDDGSTDNSGAICDEYAAAHSLFQCIHKPNGGHTSARKSGYRASRGEYVAFVDSDDWIAPDMYRRMCQAVTGTHADIVLCSHTAVMPDREEVCGTPFAAGFYDKPRLEKEIYPHMIYSGVFFKYGVSPNLWNKIFRRELLRDHLFQVPDDIILGEDALAAYSCMLEASSMYLMDEALYYYRSNADSMSRRAIPAGRLPENRKLFETLLKVIDVSAYPCMEKQLYYYFVYQSLLTYMAVFSRMTDMTGVSDMSQRRAKRRLFRQTFVEECRYPLIRKAFASVPLSSVLGAHNKLYALCVRHKLPSLFQFLLKH